MKCIIVRTDYHIVHFLQPIGEINCEVHGFMGPVYLGVLSSVRFYSRS